jgi:hypothetical protein
VVQPASETDSSLIQIKSSTRLRDRGITSLKPGLAPITLALRLALALCSRLQLPTLPSDSLQRSCCRAPYVQPSTIRAAEHRTYSLSTQVKSSTRLRDRWLTSSRPDLAPITRVLSCPRFQQPASATISHTITRARQPQSLSKPARNLSRPSLFKLAPDLSHLRLLSPLLYSSNRAYTVDRYQ